MTPYHTGVPYSFSSFSSDNRSIYRLIQDLPIGKNALHDIHLRFNVKDIWSALSMLSFKIDSVSKDIRLPVWDIRDLSIKTTVHRTNTVSVVVGGSYHPIAVDINGTIRLSNALTSVEERLSNLMQSSTSTGRQDGGRLVPDHMGWIVAMWHFGVDGLTEYTGEKFSCTWEVGQSALIRAYTKDFRNGRTHIRLERQEYPRSLTHALEEKLNSTSIRTWSSPSLCLSNRPQSELEKCGVSGSRVSFNTQNLSDSQLSLLYDDEPLCNDDRSDAYVEVNEQEIQSEYIEVPRPEQTNRNNEKGCRS